MTFSDPAFAALVWDTSHRGEKLDLTGYKETFRDNFNSLSISGSNGTGTRWFSPARENYGGAPFKEYVVPPVQPVQPVRLNVNSGQLAIRMEKVGDLYQTAHVQTTNRLGAGWTQSLGYFEMSATFPKGFATWPAFWLLGLNEPRVEIDVVEAYGGNDWDGHHAALHLARTYHPSKYTALGAVKDAAGLPLFNSVYNDMFNNRYHTYGALLDTSFIRIFYNNLELCRFPMTDYFKVPLYMNITLAMYDKEKSLFVSPKEMSVDSVRALIKI